MFKAKRCRMIRVLILPVYSNPLELTKQVPLRILQEKVWRSEPASAGLL